MHRLLFSRIMRPFRKSLRNKLITVFIGVIIIPLALSIYTTYERFSAELRKNYIISNTNLISQVNQNLSDYFSRLDAAFVSIRFDSIMGAVFQNDDIGWELHDKKIKAVSNYFYANDNVESILFYYPASKEVLITNRSVNNFFSGAEDIESTDWYKYLAGNKKDYLVQANHKLSGYNERYSLNGNVPVFSISRCYRLALQSKVYCIVTINYNLNKIEMLCNRLLVDQVEETVYSDNSGNVFYSTGNLPAVGPDIINRINLQEDQNGFFEYERGAGGDKYLVIYSKSEYNGNVLYKLISLKAVNKQASSTRDINLLISLTIIVILIFASLFISYRITRPISSLTRSMSAAGKGDFDNHAVIDSLDEIGEMSNAFNTMLQNINTLITEKYKMQLVSRLAQLKALQAQINPHFIYNTLQAIGSAALDEGSEGLYKTTLALSDMLRYSIKSGDLVTISDEIKNVKNYLTVQQFRYEDKLSYTVDIPANLENIRVPKLIFQPIVENAIIHGIEPSKSNGIVGISCIREEDFLFITIKDNGVGFEPEELGKIRDELSEYSENITLDEDRIGIMNVYQRLRIMLGDKCSMRLESKPGMGTLFEIRIPLDHSVG